MSSYLKIIGLVIGFTFLSSVASIAQNLNIERLGPGLHKQAVTHPDGTIQYYTINIPDGYDGDAPVPLILGLHYGFQGMNGTNKPEPFWSEGFFTKIYQQAFKPLNAIFLAADSVSGNWATVENEAAVMRLMDSVIATYNLDASKTIVTGYSMGAFGTWHWASKYQDRFAGAIAIAGMPADMNRFRDERKMLDVDWKIPLYVIHSEVDGLIDIEPTREYVKQLEADGKDVTFQVLTVITHHQENLLPEPMGKTVPWIERVWKNAE